MKNAFKLAGVEDLEKKAKAEYVFSCASSKERDAWVTALGTQRSDVADKRKSFKRASRVQKK